MKITEYQISEAFEFGAYTRGKKYFQIGQVESNQIDYTDNDLMNVSSRVKGNYKSFYQQKIEISRAGYTEIRIDGDCSCPVGLNCKHVAAVCFQYQFDEANKPKNVIGTWLNEIVELTDHHKNENQNNDHFIHYRLYNNKYRGSLQVYKKRILKNGNLNKGGY